jgi:NAD-dependent SIR2 family protein deacetylase
MRLFPTVACQSLYRVSYTFVCANAYLLLLCHCFVLLHNLTGLSTSAGIPDFRSENGLYSMLGQYNLPSPQSMFDIAFFKQNPTPFFQFAKQLLPGNYTPSDTHRFVKLLDSKGKLLRMYTQNIDGLEIAAGVSHDRVHQCHGSLDTAKCLYCRTSIPLAAIEADILAQEIPMCKVC